MKNFLLLVFTLIVVSLPYAAYGNNCESSYNTVERYVDGRDYFFVAKITDVYIAPHKKFFFIHETMPCAGVGITSLKQVKFSKLPREQQKPKTCYMFDVKVEYELSNNLKGRFSRKEFSEKMVFQAKKENGDDIKDVYKVGEEQLFESKDGKAIKTALKSDMCTKADSSIKVSILEHLQKNSQD